MTREQIGWVRCNAGDCQEDILRVYRIAETGKLVIRARGNGAHADSEGVITGAGAKGYVAALGTLTGTRRVLLPREQAKRLPPSFGLLDEHRLAGEQIRVDCKRHGCRLVLGDTLLKMILTSSPKRPGQIIAVDVPASYGDPPVRQSTVLPSN